MVVYETMIIASAILYGSMQSLMRCVWNTAGFVTIHERDLTIDIYEVAVVRIQDLTDESFLYCLTALKDCFPGDRADQLQSFWDLADRGRGMVFRRAQKTCNRYYVQSYLRAAGGSTSKDINRRRHKSTKGAKCLDHASLANDIAEGMFAHQSKAISDGKGGLNRSRGVALCDASHTFELAHLAKKKRRRRFMKSVQRGKAQLSDWVESHREDNNFLNTFNEK